VFQAVPSSLARRLQPRASLVSGLRPRVTRLFGKQAPGSFALPSEQSSLVLNPSLFAAEPQNRARSGLKTTLKPAYLTKTPNTYYLRPSKSITYNLRTSLRPSEARESEGGNPLMNKILFIVLDGLGDKPIKELKNRTPLEAAVTPNLDGLAQKGRCGLLDPYFTKALPTSEESHFALFGYNPHKLELARGIFTAKGAGIKLKKGDVALRGNFSTVGKDLNIVNRRAGRIKETGPLVAALSGMKIKNVSFLIKPAGEHRVGIVMRGKRLSSKISDGDPHYAHLGSRVTKIVPLDKSKESAFTAQVLNEFLERAHEILKVHPLNEARKKRGLPQANYILVRGASSPRKIPSFSARYGLKACCVAGKILYKQIGEILGMKVLKVKGANGLVSTNLTGKVKAVLKALKEYDFVFLHIKATDSLAEDGDFKGKKKFIEKIDSHFGPFLRLKDTIIVVTGDHSTCCSLKRHCKEQIPVLISGAAEDDVKKFSEKSCSKGGLGTIKQITLMARVLKAAGRGKRKA